MSPRSTEFLISAQRRLNAARLVVTEDPATALSAAYYAMLYAARAALSERDLYAKTHVGTWNLFWETFVDPGQFDGELAAAARERQRERERSDYEAWLPSPEQASEAIELAARFIVAVEAMFP